MPARAASKAKAALESLKRERAEILAALADVDAVTIFDSADVTELIRLIAPGRSRQRHRLHRGKCAGT